MTTGLGFSIGTVNCVTASVIEERPRPAVRTRRTALTFDSVGGARIGGIPQFTMAVTDFADLGRDPDPVVVGGRLWSPANLVAAVVNGLAEYAVPSAGIVSTYPAGYSDKQVMLLRQALDLSGAEHVELIPEPVAAAEWLEHEQGPLEPGFVMVYDLGGTCLDVTVVRVGPDWSDHPMVGKPQRSYDFGGRPLGSMIARYAHDKAPGSARDRAPRHARGHTIHPRENAQRRPASQSIVSIVDVDGLRAEHIRDSFDVVRECLASTGLTLSDIGQILLVGGAARPPEVARTLAELGRPVVMSADPGHSIASGAAYYAARAAAAAAAGQHRAPQVAVFSSAAVVSALAMSAATVFGGQVDAELAPLMEGLHGVDTPAEALLYDYSGDEGISYFAGGRGWASTSSGYFTGPGRSGSILEVATVASVRPLDGTPRSYRGGGEPREDKYQPWCTSAGSAQRTYADPTHFMNPLPFHQTTPPVPGSNPPVPPVVQPPVPAPNPPVTDQPVGSTPTIPSVSLPKDWNPPGGPTAPAPADPGAIPAVGGITPGTGTAPNTGATAPATGQPADSPTSGETSTGGTGTGGTATGGTGTGGTGTSGTTSGGTSSSGESTGGSTGGSTSGGSDSGGSTSGGTSGTSGGSTGGSTSGGSTGGTSSSDTTTGGTTSGGTSSGTSTGGSSSSGTSSSGESSGGSSSGGSSGDSSDR